MEVIFALDEPHYHRLRFGERNVFHGVAVATGDSPVESLRIGAVTTPVNGPSPELAFLPYPHSDRCRYTAGVEVRERAPIEIAARLESGREIPLFRYDVPFALDHGKRMQAIARCVDELPTPSAELIVLTQGIGNLQSYRDSIISGVISMKSILGGDPRSVLDIGCGTGRLVIGWHCDDPARSLSGTDINADLIDWNRRFLPNVADWRAGRLEPPLDFPDAHFDLVQLISVLTHLPLDLQRRWIAEIHRLMKPGATLLMSLHGDLHARAYLHGNAYTSYETNGYAEIPTPTPGASEYATFHKEWFARELFRDFREMALTPLRSLFPIASVQNLFIVRR